MRTLHHNTQKGFALLLSLLVLASIGVAISLTLLLGSLGATQTAGALEESHQSKGLANACAELALQQLVASTAYTGTVTVNLGRGSCTYTVASLDASTSVINATGTVNTTVRKVQIRIAVPQLTIASWQEVANF